MTSKKDLFKYIDTLRDISNNQKLIVFVGAGVSCNVKGLPSWYALIKKMADEIKYSKCLSCQHKDSECTNNCKFKEEYSTDEYLKIPQYLFNKDQNKYFEIIKNSFVKESKNINAPLSEAIFELNPVHIITTNFDDLLESCNSIYREKYDVIIKDNDLLGSNKSKYIIKMHGDINEEDNIKHIVLKEDDYLNYSQNHILIETFAKSLFTNHTILFLGYSLNDYNIKQILSWIDYLRKQNNEKQNNEKQQISYIVLDTNKFDEYQVNYFNGKNIEVININEMPLINDIPSSLFDDRGKRLYSFFKAISDEYFQIELFSDTCSNDIIENKLELISPNIFINYKILLDLLYIKQYDKIDNELVLFDKKEFNRISDFINSNKLSKELKQLFLNSGISSIVLESEQGGNIISLQDNLENDLFADELFNLYIENKYDELKKKIKQENIDIIKKCFYLSLIDSDYNFMQKEYEKIDFSSLSSLNKKISYMHNMEVISRFLKGQLFNSNKIINFIESISKINEKKLYGQYIDIYNGNHKEHEQCRIYYNKFKKNIQNKISFYDIKNFSLNQYYFYFYNNLIFKGFSNINSDLKIYISAIICSNGDYIKEDYLHERKNEKYFIDLLDFDIMTKFISTQELYELINDEYKIIELNTSEDNITKLTDRFSNLCNSLLGCEDTYGLCDSYLTIISNLALILQKLNLNIYCKNKIAESINKIFSDKKFVNIFFLNFQYQDFEYYIKIFICLFENLTLIPNIEVVKNVTNCVYLGKISETYFVDIRKFLSHFLRNQDPEIVQKEINDIINNIDVTKEFNKKVLLIRLFLDFIDDKDLNDNYIPFLSENFSKINHHALYDFIFGNILKPSQDYINTLFTNILEKYKKQKENSFFTKIITIDYELEFIILLYICKYIDDINSLKDIAEENCYLKFLLYPDDFDYSQVDFSNYMWTNFAKKTKLMEYFVKYKDKIVANIKDKIKRGKVTDTEKKILYGFLLDKKDVFSV